MKKRQKLFLYRLFLLLTVLGILPFIALSFFTHPSVDDYYYAHLYLSMGATDFYQFHFLNENTRYIGPLLHMMSPLTTHSLKAYHLLPIIWLALLFGGINFLTNQIVSLKRNKVWGISLFVGLIYLSIMPKPSDSLYWMTGAFYFIFPLALWIFWLGLAYKVLIYSSIKSGIIMILLSIIIGGLNESLSILIGMTSIFILFFTHVEKQGKRIFFTQAFLIFSIYSFLFFGGFIGQRMGQFEGELSLLGKMLKISFLSIKISIVHLQSVSVILISLGFIIGFQKIRPYLQNILSRIKVHPIILLIYSILSIYAFYFPMVYAMEYAPWRAHNNLSFYWLLLWFTNLAYFLYYYDWNFKNLKLKIPIISIVFLVFFFLFSNLIFRSSDQSFRFKSNVSLAYYELFKIAPEYNRQLKERYSLISEIAPKNKNIYVPALSVVPELIYFGDIGDDTSFWVNRATANYFELESIKTFKLKEVESK